MENTLRRRLLLCSPVLVVGIAMVMYIVTSDYLRGVVVFSLLIILVFLDRHISFSEHLGDTLWERGLIRLERFLFIGALSLLAATFFSLLFGLLIPASRETYALQIILFLFLLPFFLAFLRYAMDAEHEKRE